MVKLLVPGEGASQTLPCDFGSEIHLELLQKKKGDEGPTSLENTGLCKIKDIY